MERNWRDPMAVFLFCGGFVASCLSEYYCGVDSKNCPIDWSGVYGASAKYYIGHCSVDTSDSGLGDPMLSVSSLFLVIPLLYFTPTGPLFTPVASAYVGIASFLFHAANTRTTHILDFIGICVLSPAILGDIICWKGYNRAGTLIFVLLTTATILLRLLIKDTFPFKQITLNRYIYIGQPILTGIILLVAYKWKLLKKMWLGATFLIGGSATLIAANNIDAFWSCVHTQLIEPHFWGHLIIALGATFFSRTVYRNEGYQKL